MTSVLGNSSGTHDDLPRTGRADAGSFSLSDRYTRESGTVFLTGIQALVRTVRDRARLDRRQNLLTASLVSGYEGSPLAGYDLELAKRGKFLDPFDVVHRPALNEEAGATAVMGSQLARRTGTLRATANTGVAPLSGVVGYWYGKAPGLDRASDAIRHANLIGTDPHGGAVAFVGDDPGAKSSSVPCASELALADLYLPTLYPADSQDVLDFGVHAAILSRVSGLWSAMKISTHVADASSTALVDPDRILPVYGDLGMSPHVPSGNLLGANLMELEQNQLTTRIPRALEYARLNKLNRIVQSTSDDRIGIVAAGKTYLDVRESLRRLGLDDAELARRGIRILKLGMIYPLERSILDEFMAGLDEVIVVEEKRDFIETMIREIHFRRADVANVVGKTHEDGSTLFSRFGELDVDSVTRGLAQRLGRVHGIEPALAWLEGPARSRTRITLPLATTRTPYFCSGCPHNSSTKVADGTLVGGGIGCHAMVLVMDEQQVGKVTGVTQMGGEGLQWTGMAPFVDERHMVQNIGDGTFMHSGSLALRAAVASGDNITYKLLYNGTVAMTGGQDPVGEMNLPEILRLLQAEKVAKIVVTTDDVKTTKGQGLPRGIEVRDRVDTLEIQKELAEVPGVTVLVHDQYCAAEKRRDRKRGTYPTPAEKVVINERICEGCGDCGRKSNCLSVHPVQTEFGRKTQIDQSTCNFDFSCLQGDCPAFVTVVPGTKTERVATAPAISASSIAEPDRAQLDPDRGFSLRLTGIGGTGIVTVSAVLATAAVLDGYSARTLDMTGLAQKGGAVVSDVRVSRDPVEQPPKIGAGDCDLYLCCDGIVGADSANLKVAHPDRTTAVVSTTQIPTGTMIIDTTAAFPSDSDIQAVIDRASSRGLYLNPGEITENLFGSTQTSNMLMVGAAYQSGALPVSAEAIEQAIELNGVAVEANLQAFRRGRHAVADPQALAALVASLHQPVSTATTDLHVPSQACERLLSGLSADASEELRAVVALRIDELIGFQSEAYAADYVRRVEALRSAEALHDGAGEQLARAVAVHLHKLMAYKDEYEVARLAVDPEFAAQLAQDWGQGAVAKLQLHPPALRAMGMKKKIAIGPKAMPAMKVLARMKRLRGTPLDVFGYAGVRRTERELLAQYRDLVDDLTAELRRVGPVGKDATWVAVALALAELPDMVRGYEHVKLDNVERYREEFATLRASLDR
ncbi:indolepyruvate ferredoxin oxidoreductase [Dietzia kunjamensis subsp. schimae]|uniref:Indolepyruvate ferredoxin oxidoreductase n=1 Tax=Dietzia kunjamensis subsp. schimae TaxID=498198 RepID=A0ABY1MXS5_9ACTN|nr:indolepyruvate ferredoxin oxidoreductase family protein [Dietzia kunjamensis]MBB1015795.1 indolepyruvate ferredoxin oxidoreductase family protein [Dietzia kunjamensis subsp. schimae]SMO47278.1 indolepyruvate ferredoxin oxidoreductase [Dietzia kunjamensis subsp. schimae]